MEGGTKTEGGQWLDGFASLAAYLVNEVRKPSFQNTPSGAETPSIEYGRSG